MTTTKRENPRRLTEREVIAILDARASTKETYAKIAERFGVSLMTVYNIAKGRTWAWLRAEWLAARKDAA